MKRVLLLPSILLALLFVVCYALSGRSLPQPRTGDGVRGSKDSPIVLANMDDIKTLDVGKMSWQSDIRTAMGLWEGLTSYNPKDLSILPGVAERWEVSPDQKFYTFHLRKNARWSDGDPVTAHDFVFAWKRVLTPVTAGDYISLFFSIQGAEEYYNALAARKPADWNSVGISTPDDYTLTVQLKIPLTYFLDLCAFVPFYPLHEPSMRPFLNDPLDPAKGYKSQWTRPPFVVSNGPFTLAEWQFQKYLLLEQNPHYWDRARVRSKSICILAYKDPRAALLSYQQGRCDALSFVPRAIGEELLRQQSAGIRNDVHFRPVFGMYYFVFNCTRAPLNDPRIRKALSLVVDKKLITDQIMRMGETPSDVIVPENSILGYASPRGASRNIAEAKRLLAEAGYPDGKGLRVLEILYNTEAPHHGQVSQVIGQMWKQNLGVEYKLRALERGSFGSERRNHNFDVARSGWYGDYGDPTTWLDLLKTGDGNNDGLFSSPAYDALLNKAASEANASARFALLKDAEQLLVTDEFPYLPLFQYSDGYMFNPDKVLGLDLNVRLMTQFKFVGRNPAAPIK